MTRRAFMTLFGIPVTPSRVMENPYVISMGQLTAADHELEGGYFAIGQATAVMVKPESVGWLRLRELRNQTVSLLVRVDG